MLWGHGDIIELELLHRGAGHLPNASSALNPLPTSLGELQFRIFSPMANPGSLVWLPNHSSTASEAKGKNKNAKSVIRSRAAAWSHKSGSRKQYARTTGRSWDQIIVNRPATHISPCLACRDTSAKVGFATAEQHSNALLTLPVRWSVPLPGLHSIRRYHTMRIRT